MRTLAFRGSCRAALVGSAFATGAHVFPPVSVSWVELGRRTWREALDDDVLGLAAQLSYYLFLALFPALVFLLALASFFPPPTSRMTSGGTRPLRFSAGPRTDSGTDAAIGRTTRTADCSRSAWPGRCGAARRHWSRLSAPSTAPTTSTRAGRGGRFASSPWPHARRRVVHPVGAVAGPGRALLAEWLGKATGWGRRSSGRGWSCSGR